MSIFLIGVDQMMGSIHFGDRIAWIWRSGAYRNLLLIAMIAAAIILIRYAARQEYWRNARTSGSAGAGWRWSPLLSYRSMYWLDCSIASVGVIRC